MPKLRKFKVDFISVLKEEEPANGKRAIYKSDDGADFRFQFNLKNIRKDAKQGLVFGTVYEPDVQDTQDDWADAEQITNAAHLFLMEKRVNMVDVDHSYEPGSGTVVESFIKNGNDDRFPYTKNGSWVVVIKLSDSARGHIDEIKGLSMAGGGVYDLEALPPKERVAKAFGSPDPSNDPDADNKTPEPVKPPAIVATINTLIEQLQKFASQINGETADNAPSGRESPKQNDSNDLSTTKSATRIRPIKGSASGTVLRTFTH